MTSTRRREVFGAAALVALGVGARLGFGAAFPTEPISDFRGLVMFGLGLRDEGLAVPGYYWVQWNQGLPLLLAGLFRVFPHHVAAVARTATELVTGLVPLLPYAPWRAVLSWRTRLLTGLLLALWPGLVFYSGVAAQENWVLPPAVALAALAVRRLRDPASRGYPVAAGLLFALAAAIRQEMLLVLAPAAIVAAGLPGSASGRPVRMLRLAAAAAVPLLALAAERRAATGRFAVTTSHGGITLLGTLAPGSATLGWTDPKLFVAAVEPDLLLHPEELRRSAGRLALGEFWRRRRYHLFRSSAAAVRLAVDSDEQNLFWSLEGPGVLDSSRAAAGASLARFARPWLRWELGLLSGLFLAAAGFGLVRRDAAVLVLASAALLKLLVHLVFSPIGRLMVPAIPLAILTVSVAAEDLASASGGQRRRFGAIGLASAVLLVGAEPSLVRLAIAKDEAPPRVRSFRLLVAGGGGAVVDCAVEAGRVTGITGDRASLGGDPGRVTCRLPSGLPEGALGLDLEQRAGISLEVEGGGDRTVPRSDLSEASWVRMAIARSAEAPPALVLSSRSESSLGFGFVLLRPGARPLPRYRALP